MTPNKDRFPVTDEQQESLFWEMASNVKKALVGKVDNLPTLPSEDDFVNAGEHEDIIFEEQEKEMDKINRYFDMQNENIYEGREIDPNL